MTPRQARLDTKMGLVKSLSEEQEKQDKERDFEFRRAVVAHFEDDGQTPDQFPAFYSEAISVSLAATTTTR
jgi:hypothetical protein